MSGLISTHGVCQLSEIPYRPFKTLARSIISQQLSSKAADTITGRVRQAIKGDLSHKRILNTSPHLLREAGLSSAKTTYLIELSRQVSAKELIFADLAELCDEDVISRLVALPGIGQWTAEMFLIFGLTRPNILALGDVGLRRAAVMLYRKELDSCSVKWQPYCSVASWYLWRHLDSQ